MEKMADDEVERLKREVSVVELVQERGVKLKRHGQGLIGKCPFHNDDTPSLVVSPSTNLWNCLGACGEGGSVIDFVMKADGIGFRAAADKLAARTTTPTPAKIAEPSSERSSEDLALLSEVVSYYQETLKRTPEAVAYLETRGLVSSEMVDKFKIGFSDRTLGTRLPAKTMKAGGELRTRLQRLGIIRESGHEHFHGCITIPILDDNGQVLGLYGRRAKTQMLESAQRHMYLPGPHRGVWNVAALQASRSVILCESLIDGLTFWCAGFRHVTCAYGVNGFTREHWEAFKKYRPEQVLIAYDRDDAGDKAAEEVAKQLTTEGIQCSRVQFPKGMDANEYARKVKPAKNSLELALRNAVAMGGAGRPVELVTTTVPVVAEQKAAIKEEVQEAVVASPVIAATETAPQLSEPLLTPALPAPLSASSNEATVEMLDQEVVIQIAERQYRVRDLVKNTNLAVLKVNIFAARSEAIFVNTLNLNEARQLAGFIKDAAIELSLNQETVKKDVATVYRILLRLQEAQIQKAMEPKNPVVVLTAEEKTEALELLKDPRLLTRILGDFEKCGIVGEEVNKLTSYIASVSRKMDKPLAIILQSTSAAGKSSLMEAVLAMVPPEELAKYSALTGQALYYVGKTELVHKVLAVAEEEGAERSSYSLKLLQSEGELRIASTGKDPVSGELRTKEYHVQGPTMLMLTTTKVVMDDELQNRCLVLTVDEGREQTRAIHRQQRMQQTKAGAHAREQRADILRVHANAQRMLRPLNVLNPYASQLTFPDDKMRLRRDHMKYITLISAVTLLHQHQRRIHTTTDHKGVTHESVEVTLDDIAVANLLAGRVLGQSLDRLPPHTRNLLTQITEMVDQGCAAMQLGRTEFRFCRRHVLEHTGWGYTQVEMHLERLVKHEYVLPHRGNRGQSYEYELLYDGKGEDGARFLPGLVDADALRGGVAAPQWLQELEKSSRGVTGSSRPHHGGFPGGSRGGLNGKTPHVDAVNHDSSQKVNGNGASAGWALLSASTRTVKV